MRNKLSLMLFFLLLGMTSRAADGIFSRFNARASESSMSFSYTLEQGELRVSGTACVQDGAYRIEAGDMQIWCDGATRWTFDTAAKEVVIEAATGGWESNPMLLLSGADKLFNVLSSGETKFMGKSGEKLVHGVVLSPKDKAMGISKATLYFSFKGDPLGAALVLSDSSSIACKIDSFAFAPKSDLSSFRPATAVSDGTWVVTDLR